MPGLVVHAGRSSVNTNGFIAKDSAVETKVVDASRPRLELGLTGRNRRPPTSAELWSGPSRGSPATLPLRNLAIHLSLRS